MLSLFISDLHLDRTRPRITELFLDFLATDAVGADRLYILGDLFETWIGDDHETELGSAAAGALRRLASHGVAIGFIAGNRDFLIGPVYAAKAGMELLAEPTEITLGTRRALLSHGDALCTDDEAYQAFRAQVRDPQWQRDFLARPVAERLAFARRARDASRSHTGGAPAHIMDVNPDAVSELMDGHEADLLIHGHTHRPAIHELDAPGAQRIVLGDWYHHGSVLRASGERLELDSLPLPS